MTATKIGVVYSIAQSRVRRIIIPDDDGQLNEVSIAAGEALLRYNKILGSSLFQAQTQVTLQTGNQPQSDFCVVLDETNTVVQTLLADPTIDFHPQGTLLAANNLVGIGYLYDPDSDSFSFGDTQVRR